jgi:hypothetical protein
MWVPVLCARHVEAVIWPRGKYGPIGRIYIVEAGRGRSGSEEVSIASASDHDDLAAIAAKSSVVWGLAGVSRESE